jgi:hypothetical protein
VGTVKALLPCPFCGSTNVIAQNAEFNHLVFVECQDCFGTADSVEQWNTRVFKGAKTVSSDHSESMPPLLPGDL